MLYSCLLGTIELHACIIVLNCLSKCIYLLNQPYGIDLFIHLPIHIILLIHTEYRHNVLQNIRAEYHNIINGPPPLGLRLRKSESFLDLLQKILSKANSTTGQPVMDNIHSAPPMMEDVKSEAPTASDRLKASNFPAKFLKIGDWEVRKIYYYGVSSIWKLSISVAYRNKQKKLCLCAVHVTV
jgi:hypothetical protein